ncbi:MULTISPECIES: cation diffusion facilitator family transporter [Sphingomonas]|uniref:cation diffusion facilitator family transporter n=1 Tax=Sphingomonas TaxID=13687 RepID=UPI000DEF813F|nr:MULTISPECIES: cation diffusion facilitator family transporter [Sphingomonas]
MSAGHHHDHDHHHAPADFSRAFLVGTLLNLGFVVVEAGYGVVANSMALLADAGHNLSDVLGLLIAWGASVLAKRRATERYSFGLKKASILAALFNALLLLLAVGAIFAEAGRRLFEPEASNGDVVMWVAAAGIAVNAVTAWLFARGRHDDINIRGAYLHMASDAAVSAAVVVAGLLILLTGQQWIDPAASILVAAVILWGTWGLLKESVLLTMAGVPKTIEPAKVRGALAALPGVEAVDHLHIWPLSTTETALTVQLAVSAATDRDRLLEAARESLAAVADIHHTTIQIEVAGRAPVASCTAAAGGHHHHHG